MKGNPRSKQAGQVRIFTETIRITVKNGRLECDRDEVRVVPGAVIHWTSADHAFAILFKGPTSPCLHPVYASRETGQGHDARAPVAAQPPAGEEAAYRYGIAVADGNRLLTLDPKIIVYTH